MIEQKKLRIKVGETGAAVLDLVLMQCAGGRCVDDLEVLRADEGLRRLLGRPVMPG